MLELGFTLFIISVMCSFQAHVRLGRMLRQMLDISCFLKGPGAENNGPLVLQLVHLLLKPTFMRDRPYQVVLASTFLGL